MRTPDFPLVPAATVWSGEHGDAVGECARCTAVTAYDPESVGQGRRPLCRPCGLAALGLAGF